MSLSVWVHAEYRYQGGDPWMSMAEFEMGSGRRFYYALQKAGLADKGIPADCSSSVALYFETHGASDSIGKTWFYTAELPALLTPEFWLYDEELERIPPRAYADYAELDTVQAWQAFAQAHEVSGSPVRFVAWFAE